VTLPRPLQEEEEMLLSAFLDGELAPEDRPRVEALLDAHPEAAEWLAAARRLGEVGREIWEDTAVTAVAALVADPAPQYAHRLGSHRSMNGVARVLFQRLFRSDPEDDSSKT
jgi:anti-sigma factor RsiW